MTWTRSLVAIVPAAGRDGALDLFGAIDFAPGFSVALSATGGDPATHYGLHSWADDETETKWTRPLPTRLRNRLTSRGRTVQAFEAARGAMTISVRTDLVARAHFDAVAAAAGLQAIVADEQGGR